VTHLSPGASLDPRHRERFTFVSASCQAPETEARCSRPSTLIADVTPVRSSLARG